MATLSDYTSGTISLANGSVTVTGTGTLFEVTRFREGDTLQIQNLTAVIASVDSDTQLTLAEPWTGLDIVDGPYRARQLGDGSRVSTQAATIIELLGNGVLINLAELGVEEGKVPVGGPTGEYELVDTSTFGIQDPNGSLGKLAALTLAANKVVNTDSNGNLTQSDISAQGRALIASSSTITINGNIIIDHPSGSPSVFYRYNGANGWHTEAATIDGYRFVKTGSFIAGGFDANGNIFVGNASSSATSTTNARLKVQYGGGSTQFGAVFRNQQDSGTVMWFERSNGTGIGSISHTVSTTSFNTSSDYRLKPIVQPLMEFSLSEEDFDQLDDVLLSAMSVQPVRHNWKDEPQKFTNGFIAHELQKVCPYAVTGDKDATEEIGRATVLEYKYEPDSELVGEEGSEAVKRSVTVEKRLVEGITKNASPDDAIWEKTGERPIYQQVDMSKLVPAAFAAIQSITLMLLEQKREIDALKERLLVSAT